MYRLNCINIMNIWLRLFHTTREARLTFYFLRVYVSTVLFVIHVWQTFEMLSGVKWPYLMNVTEIWLTCDGSTKLEVRLGELTDQQLNLLVSLQQLGFLSNCVERCQDYSFSFCDFSTWPSLDLELGFGTTSSQTRFKLKGNGRRLTRELRLLAEIRGGLHVNCGCSCSAKGDDASWGHARICWLPLDVIPAWQCSTIVVLIILLSNTCLAGDLRSSRQCLLK